MPAGAGEAAGVVNAWADGASHHRIRQLVDKVPENVPLLLADAVYLNFRWADEFRVSATHDLPFHPTSEASVDVPMMRQVSRMVAGPVDVGMAAILPFAGRSGEGMHVVLPRPGLSAQDALDAVLRDPQMLVPDARPGFTRQEVDLSLPRFEMGSGGSFATAMRRAGLESLFTHADFSGISPRLLHSRIGDVIQKAWMRVDEKGVEAAAVTAIMAVTAAAPGASPPPPLKLVFDRPFAVVIRDKATLFAALVRNPLLHA
jgi:serpin B